MNPGTRIGPYEIVERLGAGGMGEVYRGRDARLGRDVALKVLPAGLAADADSLARLEREARSLAALNHPNIAHVYGLEQADSAVIVMELVEGEDLAQRLGAGALPLQEALEVARQIAEALEAAHEAGIVHRDLKPANVKVRADGTVKVLDFGLAKVTGSSGGAGEAMANSPTLVSPAATGIGVLMGTAAYMSPEQARGKPVDRRADVWAFGCTLFEMLAGRRPFGGDDVSMTLASVLKKDLDWSALPASTPAPVRRMLERCFETEPRRRYQSIGDARVEIEDWIAHGFDTATPYGKGGAHAAPLAWWQRPVALVAGAMAIAIASAGAIWLARPTLEAPVRIVNIERPAGLNMSDVRFDVPSVAVAPDGSSLLFTNGDEVYVRRFDDADATRMAQGAEGGAVYSPDGTQLVYDTPAAVTRVNLATGSASKVADSTPHANYGMHWGRRDYLYLSKGGDRGLRRLDMSTGEDTQVLALEGSDTRFVTPWELPNGDLMFSILGRGRIEVYDGTARHLVHEVIGATIEGAVSTPEGTLLWAQWGENEGTWAARFSLETRSIIGEPVRVSALAGPVSVSDNGLLIVEPREARGAGRSAAVLVGRDGKLVRELIAAQPGLRQPRLSPDGKRLAVIWQTASSGDEHVFVHDLERRTSLELGAGAPRGNSIFPAWMPDGSKVAYITGPTQNRALLLEDATGSSTPVVLVAEGVGNAYISVSADGKYVLYRGVEGDIWYVETSGGEPVRFRQTDDVEEMPTLSPDGRHIAYGRIPKTGTAGLFVERFPEGGGLQLVDSTGWDDPHWSRDGRILYYQGGSNEVWEVKFDPDTGTLASRPERLFGGLSPLDGFDVTADGQFVVPRAEAAPADGPQRAPILIENWPALLQRR